MFNHIDDSNIKTCQYATYLQYISDFGLAESDFEISRYCIEV